MSGNGFETKYDKYSGDWMEQQKTAHAQPGIKLNFGKRYCESCKSLKPKDSKKAVKGWKCSDCKKKT